jgi:hypothetical protein
MNKEIFPLLFSEAWRKIKPEYAINGFRKTGIWPINRSAITADEIKVAVPWNDIGEQTFFDRIQTAVASSSSPPNVTFFLREMQNLLYRPIVARSLNNKNQRRGFAHIIEYSNDNRNLNTHSNVKRLRTSDQQHYNQILETLNESDNDSDFLDFKFLTHYLRYDLGNPEGLPFLYFHFFYFFCKSIP